MTRPNIDLPTHYDHKDNTISVYFPKTADVKQNLQGTNLNYYDSKSAEHRNCVRVIVPVTEEGLKHTNEILRDPAGEASKLHRWKQVEKRTLTQIATGANETPAFKGRA